MIAPQIHRFFVCELTGNAVIEYSFSLTDEHHTFCRPLATRENAVAWLREEQETWLRAALEKYVNHKRHLIPDNSPKKEALKTCIQATEKYQGYTLVNICSGFIRGRKCFEEILPGPDNASYESSLKNLNELTSYCERIVKEAAK
jgi:hypothetical protein